MNIHTSKAIINRHPVFFAVSILIIVGLIIYSNNYKCTWHFDDLSYIVNNPTIRDLSDIKSMANKFSSGGRTVVLYSFALNYQVGKADVLGYHVVNNFIHIVGALFVYWISLQLFLTPRIRNSDVYEHRYVLSLFIALIFLTHPVQTQAVTYICQRFASLATLFYAASISFYLKARLGEKGRPIFFVCASIAAILGMFSKQIVITLPICILFIEWLFFTSEDFQRKLLKKRILIPVLMFLLIIPALYSFRVLNILSITHKSSGSHEGDLVNAYYYPLTQLRVIPTYLRLLIFPVGQRLLYDFPTSKSFFEGKTFAGFLLIISILGIGFKMRKKWPLITFGIFWFFLTISVESSFIPIRHVIFEHRVYLPSIGFSIFLVAVIYALFKNPNRMMIVLSLIVLILSFLTYQRNKVWLTELTLWSDVKAKSPREVRAYLNSGIAYSEMGKLDAALDEFNKALEINPKNVMTLNNKGIIYMKRHLFDSAILEYDKALNIDPNWEEIWNNRGDARRHKGEYQLALEDYHKALEINPQLYRALSNRGVVYSHLGQNDLALKDFNQAIQTDADFIEAYQNRGNLHGILKNYDLAVKDFSKVIEAKTNVPEVYNNRGNAYRHLGEYELAFDDYNKAIELDSNFSEAYNNRGVIYRQWNKMDLALADYNKAITLNPNYISAYNNRGNLLSQWGQYDLALKDFDIAIELNPENKVFYFNRAQVHIGRKDYRRALKDAQKAKTLGLQKADQLIEQLNGL
ncbi:MAG: tetratricopeptide repeat protein [Candidatus Omnitrophica bacterium]|nr:tetratricopeptide repeat protein [Candidatus Omnitrophota bacterium]